jgi:hypothetical protein
MFKHKCKSWNAQIKSKAFKCSYKTQMCA